MRIESFPRRIDDETVVWDGIQIDITPQKLADVALQEGERLRVALEKEHELNQLKDRMLERISHEFRTPLAIINTSAELLERYAERMQAEKRLEHLHKIRQQTEHVTEVLDDIRHLGREGLGRLDFNPAVLDLRKLCEAVASDSEWNNSSRYVTFSPVGELNAIFADQRLIQTILANLISNAVKFSREQQTVRLTAETCETEVILIVHDGGIGISQDDIPHLFEPFFRGANTVEIGGLGLGLSIVKEAVDLHHGTIIIESSPGEGTTATVRLPQ
jgi:signal transduction histidine kinase